MTRKRKGCLHDTIVHAQIPHYTQKPQLSLTPRINYTDTFASTDKEISIFCNIAKV